ncbi:MAG: hypothetical protein HDS68_01390 [Bacteroidales bacterium]|nr:hypothetical protein [Bacteroidales bacterium]
MRYNILGAAVLAGAAFTTASAQLNKEITIEREIVPEVRAASRLDIFPRTLTISSDKVNLDFLDYTTAGTFANALRTLQPASTEAAIAQTPYRGYVDAGYFPAANVTVSAGYSILSDSLTALNVWGQLNNISYKDRPFTDCEKVNYNRFFGALGVGFARRMGSYGTLSVSTDFAFRSFKNLDALIMESDPDLEPLTGKTGQGTVEWNIGAAWHGNNGSGLRYHAGADFGIFNFNRTSYLMQLLGDGNRLPEDMVPEPVHQRHIGFDLGLSHTFGDRNRAGLDITADFLSYNSFCDPTVPGKSGSEDNSDGEYGFLAAPGSGKTIGILSINPYYNLLPQAHAVSLRIGAQVDVTFNYGKALHVAPDILLGINPASSFGAWLKLGGGECLNSLKELSEFTPYISPLFAYGTSNIPVDGELGLRVGPFKGVAISVDLAYAAANSWLMPVYGEFVGVGFQASDLRSWKAGVHLTWNYRSIVALDAGFETRLQKDASHAWLYWRDGARSRLNASLTVRPIAALAIDLGYTMSASRSMGLGQFGSYEADERFCLKDRNLFDAGVSYAITDAFTVFGRVENILDNKAYEAVGVPAQGLTGAVGFGWKF